MKVCENHYGAEIAAFVENKQFEFCKVALTENNIQKIIRKTGSIKVNKQHVLLVFCSVGTKTFQEITIVKLEWGTLNKKLRAIYKLLL